MGGLPVLVASLDSSYALVREKSSEVLAEISQNNPMCQQEMINLKVINKLLNLIDKDSNTSVKVKALYATSSE